MFGEFVFLWMSLLKTSQFTCFYIHEFIFIDIFFTHTQTPFYTAPINPRSPATQLWHFCVAPPSGLPAAATEDSRTRVWLIRTNHQTIWPIDFYPTRPSHLFPTSTWTGLIPCGAFRLQPPSEAHVHMQTQAIYHVSAMWLSYFNCFEFYFLIDLNLHGPCLILISDNSWFGSFWPN